MHPLSPSVQSVRNQGEKGICNAGSSTVISSYGPHYGEEDVLVEDMVREPYSSAGAT